MTEQENLPAKRGNVFQNALRAVKGEDTTKLVEDFTAEMTLVAEGLCEDQGRLRKDVEHIRVELDRTEQSLTSRIDSQETSLHENDRDNARKLEELSKRLAALENRLNEKQKQDKDRDKDKEKKPAGLIRQITILVSIICGTWLLVSLINLIPH